MLACLLAAGCAGVSMHEVRVEPIRLPSASVARSATRVGVHFTPAFLSARVDAELVLMNDRHVWRHAIGEAAAWMVRSALAEVFSEVVELPQWPLPELPDALDAVIVPRVPTMHMTFDQNALVAPFRNTMAMALDLHGSSGDPVVAWTVSGTVATGIHGPLFVRQRYLDAVLLRSTAGALIASLQREPALARLTGDARSAATSPEVAGAATGSGIVALRLDAGVPQDDGIETRIAECLGAALGGRDGGSGPTPAARLRDEAFPWFEPGTVTLGSAGIEATLALPGVRAALRRLDVGRLVLFTARDADRARKDALACFGGVGGGACFGIFEEKTGYVVDLAVWDAASAQPIRQGRSEVERTLGVLGVLLPIPYFHSNAAQVCEYVRGLVTGAP